MANTKSTVSEIEKWQEISDTIYQFWCKTCGVIPRHNPSDIREWGCPLCQFRTYSVSIYFGRSVLGDLPRIELFARERADGWDAWGNEVD